MVYPAGKAGGAGGGARPTLPPHPSNAPRIIKNRLSNLLKEAAKKYENRGKLTIKYTFAPTDDPNKYKLKVTDVDTSQWKGKEEYWVGYSKKEIANKIKTRLDGHIFQKPAEDKIREMNLPSVPKV